MNKKGFTLVELLSVISILSLLVVVVATKGFGAFDNSKEKINDLAEKEIVEAINVLMTEVEFCDDSVDSELLSNFSRNTCEDLQKAFSDYGPNPGITVSSENLIEAGYVTGKNAIELYKTNTNLEYTIFFNLTDEAKNNTEEFKLEYKNKTINCNNCN